MCSFSFSCDPIIQILSLLFTFFSFGPKLRLVTFDATNTFLHFRRPIAHQYADVAAAYGVAVDIDDLEKNFRRCYKKLDSKYPIFGRGSSEHPHWKSWWVELVKSTLIESGANTNGKLLSAVSYHLIKLYSTGDPWQVSEGVHDLLSQVSSVLAY
jgi:FMN phosphatase YigB (HAD superfamily)